MSATEKQVKEDTAWCYMKNYCQGKGMKLHAGPVVNLCVYTIAMLTYLSADFIK